MSGLLSISSNNSGSNNASPIISNLRVDGEIGTNGFTIKYTAKDFENTILRHYISINDEKKEITKNVGYESYNNEFTYKLNLLNPNTNYNIKIEVTDGIDLISSSINIKTNKIQIFGIKIDESNSDPEKSVTYIEDAIGMSIANSTSLGDWENKWPFNKIRIVGFKNGKVIKEIKKTDKTKYIDGTTVSTDVDVMVEIPKIYWNFTSIENGYELRISDTKVNNNYDCYAHKVSGIEKNFIYVGAYLGYIEEYIKLRSKSGVPPTTYTTLADFRTYAHNVGEGYQQMNWFTLLLLQILYLIAYKNLNSQEALGYGFTNGSSFNYTGGTNTKGFIYGEKNGYDQMCFLGIEDFYGNLYQFIDGMVHNNSHQIMVTPDNKTFNNNASGYKNIGKFINNNIDGGYISKVAHTNESGFFPTEIKGSNTTYYCDYCYAIAGTLSIFGGGWNDNPSSGAFYLRNYSSTSSTGSNLGSRLVFLG